MNSTWSTGTSRMARRGLWALLLLPFGLSLASAADPALPYPPQLARDVNFWVKVYTQIDTDSGYLHDQYDLAVIYDTLHFAPGSPPRVRQRIVNRARDHYIAELRKIASGKEPLSAEDERIKALWGADATPDRLLEATQDIRFQLGQANRFKAGLIRSGAWQQDIARVLKAEGLPPQLAALPLVESSYNPDAYSKVGAAGLWQFMRSTGRRFMRIDRAVDDRMDPFRATDAAAQLLAYNHRILGTWPLALTAYNHGVAGMRRAVEKLGTTNIVTIVRDYSSRTFGFASRNFYVSFLAALRIEQDPQKYFGTIVPMREERFREVRMPAYVSIRPLEHALDIDTVTLRELNPALRPAVWRGWLAVPRGYELRLPAAGPTLTTAMLARKLGPELLARAAAPRRFPSTRAHLVAAVAKSLPSTSGPVAAAVPLAVDGGSATGSQILPGRSSLRDSPAATYYSRVRFAASAASTTTLPASIPRGAGLPQLTSKFGLASRRLLDFNGVDGTALVAEDSGSSDSDLYPGGSGALSYGAARTDSGPGGGGSSPDLTGSQGAAAEAGGDSEDAQPVSASQADALGPSLGPADGSSQSADPTDYSVAPNGSIRVAAEETLGHYAEWLGVSAQDLRRINRLRFHQSVRIGRRIRLDFRRVPPEEFEARRREYHQALDASYFAAHRIAGTEQYTVQPGDSLWTLTQRFSQLPPWLLRQYNPDTDFADLRPGTQLVVPRIEDVSAGSD
jgi:membrane-bound lytic murein transglycosylase D